MFEKASNNTDRVMRNDEDLAPEAFHVCHPSVDVQSKICRSLSSIRQAAARIESGYEANLATIRPSLLQKSLPR